MGSAGLGHCGGWFGVSWWFGKGEVARDTSRKHLNNAAAEDGA